MKINRHFLGISDYASTELTWFQLVLIYQLCAPLKAEDLNGWFVPMTIEILAVKSNYLCCIYVYIYIY